MPTTLTGTSLAHARPSARRPNANTHGTDWTWHVVMMLFRASSRPPASQKRIKSTKNYICRHKQQEIKNLHLPYINGILPKGPYLPCVDRALLAGYPRYTHCSSNSQSSSTLSQSRYITVTSAEWYLWPCSVKKNQFLFHSGSLHCQVISSHCIDVFNSLWPTDAMWSYKPGSKFFSGNGLLPDGTKLLPEPILTYH